MNFLQNRNRLTDFGKVMVTKGDRWGSGRDGLGVWDWHMHIEMYGMIHQQGAVVQHSIFAIVCVGKDSEREWLCVNV